MTKDEVIEKLSDLRSQYNCFDENEAPYYTALCIAIKSVQIADNMNKAIPVKWINEWLCYQSSWEIHGVKSLLRDWGKEQGEEE